VIIGHGLTPNGWVEAARVSVPDGKAPFVIAIEVVELVHALGYAACAVSATVARLQSPASAQVNAAAYVAL
jgi:hypothetical protein